MILLLVVDHRIPLTKTYREPLPYSACREDNHALQKQIAAMTNMADHQRREIAWLKHGKVERPPVDFGHEQMAK